MKVHPKTEKVSLCSYSADQAYSVIQIPLDVFILSFQDSMDDSDDSSKILVSSFSVGLALSLISAMQPVLEKHIEMLNSGGAARGKTSQEEEAANVNPS